MDKILINWLQTSYDDLDYEEDAYFYALIDADDELVYIGNVYEQEIQDGIEGVVQDFDLDTKTLGIFIGYIEDMSYERISKQIVADAKNLMIYVYQPEYNTKGKKSYSGRAGFQIKSVDLFEDVSTISCNENEEFTENGEVLDA